MPFWMPFFRVFVENGRQMGPADSRGGRHLAPNGHPKMLLKRIRDATLIFHRFGIHFGSDFEDILMVWAPKIDHLAPQGRPKTL